MAIYNFPEVEKIIIDKEMYNRIAELNSEEQKKENEINKQVLNLKPQDTSGVIPSILGIGFMVGFGACLCTCDGTMDTAVGSFFAGTMIAFILGVVFYALSKSADEKSHAEAAHKITQEKDNLAKKTGNIRLEAQEKYAKYSMDFEREAQIQSVKFAESELAKEVIDWMTSGFINMIKAADRREHVNAINVPFEFKVFKDKITCTLGEYDFNIKRCSYLDSPIEQAALARALASAIQLNIVMDLPQDISGTSINVSLSYEYTNESANATLHYMAPNGFYQAVKKWS